MGPNHVYVGMTHKWVGNFFYFNLKEIVTIDFQIKRKITVKVSNRSEFRFMRNLKDTQEI